MRSLGVAAVLAVVALAGCASGGGGGSPAGPIEVDYTTFSDTLMTGRYTGALSLQLLAGGEPARGVTGRIALAGATADEGYVALSTAQGYWRVGNVPGGDYELFLTGPTIAPAVYEVTVIAGMIRARTLELEPVH